MQSLPGAFENALERGAQIVIAAQCVAGGGFFRWVGIEGGLPPVQWHFSFHKPAAQAGAGEGAGKLAVLLFIQKTEQRALQGGQVHVCILGIKDTIDRHRSGRVPVLIKTGNTVRDNFAHGHHIHILKIHIGIGKILVAQIATASDHDAAIRHHQFVMHAVVGAPEMSGHLKRPANAAAGSNRIENANMNVGMLFEGGNEGLCHTRAQIVDQKTYPNPPICCFQQFCDNDARRGVVGNNIVLQIQRGLGHFDQGNACHKGGQPFVQQVKAGLTFMLGVFVKLFQACGDRPLRWAGQGGAGRAAAWVIAGLCLAGGGEQGDQ